MKKLDRRVVRTRRAIGDALIGLAREKEYDSISVRDITQRADVGYATFFRHYKSKDEVLTNRLRGMIDVFLQEAREAKTLHEESLAMYTVLHDHREVVSLGLSLPKEHPAVKPLWDEAIEIVAELYLPRDEDTIPMAASVNHVINSVAALINWWLSEGDEYSPEQMATMQSELIIKVTETVALDHRVQRLRDKVHG